MTLDQMDNDGQLATVLSGTTAEQGGDEHDTNHLTHQLVSQSPWLLDFAALGTISDFIKVLDKENC